MQSIRPYTEFEKCCDSPFSSLEFDELPASHVPDTMFGLHQIAKRVLEGRGKLLILIYECDRLENRFIFENPATDNKVVLKVLLLLQFVAYLKL